MKKKHINQYAKKHEAKILNKRVNDEIKEKPEIKYSFKIDKESELLNRIKKMVAIKNDKNNKKFEIQFCISGKKITVSKRYAQITLTEAMDLVKTQQKLLKQQLTSQSVVFASYMDITIGKYRMVSLYGIYTFFPTVGFLRLLTHPPMISPSILDPKV